MTAEALAAIADDTEEQTPLPEGWRLVRVGEVCTRLDYGFTTSADFAIKEPKFLRITDIQNGYVDWSKVPSCKISEKEEQANLLKDGDIVFARTGGTVGKSFLICNPPRAVFASYLIRLSPNELVDNQFLYFFFQSNDYWRQIKASAQGGAQPNVNATVLSKLKLALPPTIEEQRRIATILDEQMNAVEQARRAVEDQLAAARLLPNAFLRSVFESEDARNWKTEHFGNLVDNFDGLRIPLSQSERKDKKGVYPYYGASGIIDYLDEYIFDGEFMLIGEDGANLLSRSTSIAFKASGQFWVNNHAHIVRPKKEISMDYLIHFFAFTDLSPFVNGMAQPKLSQRDLNRLPILLPSKFEEQKEIAENLNKQMQEVENLKKTLTEQLHAIKKMPSALLRKAFAGEI